MNYKHLFEILVPCGMALPEHQSVELKKMAPAQMRFHWMLGRHSLISINHKRGTFSQPQNVKQYILYLIPK